MWAIRRRYPATPMAATRGVPTGKKLVQHELVCMGYSASVLLLWMLEMSSQEGLYFSMHDIRDKSCWQNLWLISKVLRIFETKFIFFLSKIPQQLILKTSVEEMAGFLPFLPARSSYWFHGPSHWAVPRERSRSLWPWDLWKWREATDVPSPGSTEPVEPTEPDEPSEPDEPDEPIEPSEPTEPDEPSEPTEPDEADVSLGNEPEHPWHLCIWASVAFIWRISDRSREGWRNKAGYLKRWPWLMGIHGPWLKLCKTYYSVQYLWSNCQRFGHEFQFEVVSAWKLLERDLMWRHA